MLMHFYACWALDYACSPLVMSVSSSAVCESLQRSLSHVHSAHTEYTLFMQEYVTLSKLAPITNIDGIRILTKACLAYKRGNIQRQGQACPSKTSSDWGCYPHST